MLQLSLSGASYLPPPTGVVANGHVTAVTTPSDARPHWKAEVQPGGQTSLPQAAPMRTGRGVQAPEAGAVQTSPLPGPAGGGPRRKCTLGLPPPGAPKSVVGTHRLADAKNGPH